MVILVSVWSFCVLEPLAYVRTDDASNRCNSQRWWLTLSYLRPQRELDRCWLVMDDSVLLVAQDGYTMTLTMVTLSCCRSTMTGLDISYRGWVDHPNCRRSGWRYAKWAHSKRLIFVPKSCLEGSFKILCVWWLLICLCSKNSKNINRLKRDLSDSRINIRKELNAELLRLIGLVLKSQTAVQFAQLQFTSSARTGTRSPMRDFPKSVQ